MILLYIMVDIAFSAPKSTYLGVFTLTAYDKSWKSCGKWSKYGLTKTGKKVKEGYVAIDTRKIALGSRIYIEGMGYYSAEDIGSGVKDNHIDIYMNSYKKAIQFGHKKARVWRIQ